MSTRIKKIHHFYSRAGFGLPPEYYFSEMSLTNHLDMQFEASKKILLFTTKKSKVDKKLTKEQRELLRKESRWQSKKWFDRMVSSRETALTEKMSLFWHGHLACRVILGRKVAANYINAIRKNALGNYRDLLLDVSKTAAMIRYLNNQQNKKSSPNENFAREVMELFTIGRGGYSENDIKEAARAFTGWSSNLSGDFVFRKAIHDDGEKTFMGKTGHFTGEDIIDIILEKPETAMNIARKIYAYFVSEQIDEEKVEELGQLFYDSNYDISVLMRTIFESEWFYAVDVMNQQIKSPIQLLVNFCQITNAEINGAFAFGGYSRRLGQKLLDPPNVAGWPGGKAWIDNASLALRMNLGLMLLGPKVNKKIDIRPNTEELFALLENKSKDALKDLSMIMIGYDLSAQIVDSVGSKDLTKKHLDKIVAAYASQLEFQMC